jgi:ribonuclease HII
MCRGSYLAVDFYLKVLTIQKVNEKNKTRHYDEKTNNALAYSISFVQNDIIDSINILNATFKAMADAVKGLSLTPDFVLIDGNRIKGLDIPHECIVKGDIKSISIAAASILAKVSRDRYMCTLDEMYPQYGFKIHKGYRQRPITRRCLS